ncbi:MAG: response regulator [Alphaproteobacteria bacterium]|nr:response regulator [Alphaproteobacteria bacterium]
MSAEPVRVLVVDDELSVLQVLCENLEDCGFEVSQAHDGEEAVRMIEQADVRPHVVITDIIMPRQEGLETITELRAKYPDIFLIAISGGGRTKSADFLQLAARVGADAVMPKPLDIDALEKTVRELVS